MVGGIGMVAGSGVMYYKNRDSDQLDVTKVTPKGESRSDSKTKEKPWPPAMHISTIQAASVPSTLDRN